MGKRILAINFGGIGDEIFFLPTLISLKKEFPDSEISLALEPRSKGIVDLTDKINDLILIDVKGKNKYLEMLKLLFKAKRGKYDIVVSSGGNKLISILLFLTGIKIRCGYNTGKLSQKLLTYAVELNKNQYACKMYHDLIRPLTEYNTELPEINIDKKEKIVNTVLIHPGVSKLSVQKKCIKTITPEVWANVIDLLVSEGKKVLLVGGPDDRECIETILKTVRTQNFENLYGTTKNLKELAELISSAEKFLCSDSAPLHVAVALGVKTYVIFGPTDVNALTPKSENVIPIMSNDSCELKPCLWARRQTTCEDLDCLKITAEQIANTVCKKD
ncbi:MAG: glycosyltransferase family 9 protein [Candidatus Gastranaerophilales bacterium]|nr:glycosyltransferase family 9 protein [Candidatus Gastranaerophilales bacterium]